MGAQYRRKYTVLRHWLFNKSKAGFVGLEIAEEKSRIDLDRPDLVVFRRENPIGGYGYGGEHLYPKRDLPVAVG
jgi:hypothetical protein